MIHNHWVCRDAAASWTGRLPPDESPERLLALVRSTVQAGEREQVWQPREMPPPHPFRAAPGHSYADHLERLWREHGIVPSIPAIYGVAPSPQGSARVAARLAFLDEQGVIREEDVEDPGALLSRLRPDHIESAHRCMARVPPLRVFTDREPLVIRVETDTDIWFPRVLGLMEDELTGDPPPEPDGLYDNRALAERHTPRLNRFVAEVRRLVLAAGGAWETSPAELPRYAPMYDELGIKL